MGKTNYNKVEDSFEKGMEKIKRGWLLEEADVASGKKEKRTEDELTPKQLMLVVDLELKWLRKQDKDTYKTLDLSKKEVDKLLLRVKDPENVISDEDLEELKRLKMLIHDHKKRLEKEEAGGKQIEDEKSRHVYKRHNIKEKWIPLDTHADWNKHEKGKKS